MGCEVRLSDGRIGRVIENTPRFLERPKVYVDGNTLDLANDRDLLSLLVVGEVEDEE